MVTITLLNVTGPPDGGLIGRPWLVHVSALFEGRCEVNQILEVSVESTLNKP